MIDQDKLLLFSPQEILLTVKLEGDVFSLCSASHQVFNHHVPRPHHLPSCASYIDLHIGVSVASVPLNLEDLMENQDDAVLGLNDSAVYRNVVRKRLRTRGKENLFRQTRKNVAQRCLRFVRGLPVQIHQWTNVVQIGENFLFRS